MAVPPVRFAGVRAGVKEMTSGRLTLYCDGGVIGRNPSPIGGTWAWCLVNTATGERVAHDSGVVLADPDALPTVSNNLMEYVAAVRALEYAPAHWVDILASDSQITLGRLFAGWGTAGIPEHWQARGRAALGRVKGIKPLLLQGHPTRKEIEAGVGRKGYPVSGHNVWCDRECGRRAREVMEGHYDQSQAG